MRIEVKFKTKSQPISWSDQKINFITKEGINVSLKCEREMCELILQGTNDVTEFLYAIWELLAWNDGYFYTPIEYVVDGCKREISELIRVSYYITDEKWRDSALLIGKNTRDISEKTIKKYMEIRSKGRQEKSMNQSMFSSYFYLFSKNYEKINIEHRLVLLMHICDGFAIAYLNGSPDNNSGNINTVLNRLDVKQYKSGAQMLGVSPSKAKNALGETRNELTHYEYKESSLGSFINDPNTVTDNMVNLYALYVLNIAIRVALLETIGVAIEETVKEYLLDELLDWIKLEKHLEEECVIPRNLLRQILWKLQNSQENQDT